MKHSKAEVDLIKAWLLGEQDYDAARARIDPSVLAEFEAKFDAALAEWPGFIAGIELRMRETITISDNSRPEDA